MDDLIPRWRSLVDRTAADLGTIPEAQLRWRPAPDKWSVIEIIGHLVDSATHNGHRFVAAQLGPDLVFPGYDQVAWVRLQGYQRAEWRSLLQLWVGLNLRLMEVVAAIPPEAMGRPRSAHNLDEIAWRPVSRHQATTLGYLVADYVDHLEHHIAQVRARVAAQHQGHPVGSRGS